MPTPQKIASPNKEQVRRWIVFDQLLRSNIGYSAEELLRKINTKLEDDEIIQRNGKLKKVSIRTIYNDLKDLQDIYGGKVTITKENGKYRFYRDEKIMNSKFANMYEDSCNLSFDIYSKNCYIL